ncbi:MAG: hypothetical protein M1826_003394 [Phylliscum demangeonii]|nr:MAG: hypothetical protein M1826_003394 [Phylliscum demangeonii]
MATMTTRLTRASAARLAILTASLDKPLQLEHLLEPPQQLSSPPATPIPTKGKQPAGKPAEAKKLKFPNSGLVAKLPTPASSRKRKRAAAPQPEVDINELPHNLGKLPTSAATGVKEESKEQPVAPKRSTRPKAVRDQVKENLKEELATDEGTAGKGGPVDAKAALDDPALAAAAEELVVSTEAASEQSPTKAGKGRKPKANPYGLTPGQTPFPDWPHPTPEECQEVNDLLSAVHGEVKAPATIPAPSTTVSGCGEVPSILDALIRTLLSAATTGTNSSRAFKGLVDKFGILQEGIGKGSVDWNRVRRADLKEVFEAIKSGGLAAVKSKRIKEILEMVYEENLARRNALLKAEHDPDAAGPAGAEHETKAEQRQEIARADEHVLSLDHLHVLSSDEALSTLIKYPGIGPKTASCVLLFCMQRPSFAVDTHVFRLCNWLGWVPPGKATRNTTYSHCEVRVPDHLKYPLHQLFIRHGKTCPRCRAATSAASEDWDKGCPIDHLVKRTGKRKGDVPLGGAKGKKRKTGKKGKKGTTGTKVEEMEEEEDSSDLSSVPDDDQGEEAEEAEDAGDADDAEKAERRETDKGE